MALARSLVAELEQEGKSTVRMLARVPLDHLDWVPHPKSMSLGRLAWHLASIPATAVRLVGVGRFDLADARPPQTTNAPDFVAAYERNLAEVVASIGAMDDDALREPFTLLRGGTVVIETRKVVIIRTVLMNHSYHHRGQLSVYLRLLDVPLPATYGTSADETM